MKIRKLFEFNNKERNRLQKYRGYNSASNGWFNDKPSKELLAVPYFTIINSMLSLCEKYDDKQKIRLCMEKL